MPYGLSPAQLEALCAVFAAYPAVQAVWIYGSRARGDYRPGSDIDLCIFGEGLDLRMESQLYHALDDLLLPYHIDLALAHKLTNSPLLARIEQEGQWIYQS